MSSMENLKASIHSLLKSKKYLIVCLGNEIMGDDGIGHYIGMTLKSTFPDKVINAHHVPVSFLGKIAEYDPELIMFIDAIDLSEPPGTVALFSADIVSNTNSTTTHYQETSDLLEFLEREIGHKVEAHFVCIQIKTIELLADISQEVKTNADELVLILTDFLEQI